MWKLTCYTKTNIEPTGELSYPSNTSQKLRSFGKIFLDFLTLSGVRPVNAHVKNQVELA